MRPRTRGGGAAGHPGRRCRAGPGAARRGRGGDGFRGPRSALDRGRLLRARVRPTGTRAVRRCRTMDRGDGALVQDERHRQPPRALPRPPRRDPEAARVMRRGRDGGARRVRGAAPVPATRDGMAVDRARADPASQGRHRGCRGGLSGRSWRRLGSAARSCARAAGPGRRSHGRRLDPGRARASDAGALQGAPARQRAAAGAAARGAGRDRDRSRRHRSGALGGRRVDPGSRPVRKQGAGRRRDAGSRTGAARRGRSGRRGAVVRRSRAAVERGRRAIRGCAGAGRFRRRPARER